MSTTTAAITTREVKAVQEILGQFIEHPWYDYNKITALPANGPEILTQALRQLRPLIAAAATPELQDRLAAGAAGLEALHGELGGCRADAEGGYPLTAAQIRRFIRVWENLEGARRALAVTMLDRLGPYMGVLSIPRGPEVLEKLKGKTDFGSVVYRKYLEEQNRLGC